MEYHSTVKMNELLIYAEELNPKPDTEDYVLYVVQWSRINAWAQRQVNYRLVDEDPNPKLTSRG